MIGDLENIANHWKKVILDHLSQKLIEEFGVLLLKSSDGNRPC